MKQLTKIIESCRVANLSINNCRIGDIGGVAIATGLSALSHLKSVSARLNELSDPTAKAFAEVLSKNCSLNNLDLSSNLIHDAGGDFLALAIIQNTKLTKLNLSGNNL